MSGELQTRKRKDKRKKRGDDGSRQEDIHDRASNDRGEEDVFSKDDSDEKNTEEHHDPHHETHGGVFAKLLFGLLFIGLLGALGTIFFQLKGTDLVDTPIKESRYVNILESFVDEHFDDHNDEHDEVLGHSEEISEVEEEEHKSGTEEVTNAENEEPGTPEVEEKEKESIAELSSPEPVLEPDLAEDEVTEELVTAEGLLSENEEESMDAEDAPRQESEDISNLEVDIHSKEENMELHHDYMDNEPVNLYVEKVQDDDGEDVKSQDDGTSDHIGVFDGFFEETFVAADESDKELENDEPNQFSQEDEHSLNIDQRSVYSEDNVPDVETTYHGYYAEFEEDDESDDDDDDNLHAESKSVGNVEKERMEENKGSRASYPASSISNDYDYLIREELDDAHQILEEDDNF